VRRIALTRRAGRDLERIARRSEETWGVAQRERYMGAIASHLELLSVEPELARPVGPERPDVSRSRVGRHVVFFRLSPSALTVLPVLHSREDHRKLFRGGGFQS